MFSLTTLQGKIDIVLLIDSSASMGEEIAHVKKNISSFLSDISKRANSQVTVVAPIKPLSGVDIAQVDLRAQLGGAPHLQLNLSI
ncbi:MAG: VWA domain-containing protein [Proteobacteria bacterium]|nr:MAG: VWA domain-containing protein [Pseudomonadota bacterium]